MKYCLPFENSMISYLSDCIFPPIIFFFFIIVLIISILLIKIMINDLKKQHMSQNNQILVKGYKGKWYVFDHLIAESWGDKNELSIKDAKKSFDKRADAINYAMDLNNEDDEYGMPHTEYGVSTRLVKDGADVLITE